MTRFEEIGAELQGECATIDQAVKTLQYSCRLCASRGINITCDRCAIAVAHEQVCAVILDIEESKRHEAIKNLTVQKRNSGSNGYQKPNQRHIVQVWRG